MAAEQVYGDFSSSPGRFAECCEVDDSRWEVQPYLKSRVNKSDACYRVGKDSIAAPSLPVSDKILDSMKTNANENNRMYWQYLGTEEGTFMFYPARKADDCGNYDPRFRPWYVETATPVPKDLVIVLDKSDSMKIANIMDLAKDAAKTVIDTLNPNDRVGVVYFSDDATTPVSAGDLKCAANELTYATPENKALLKAYIAEVSTHGGTRYIPAIQAAFRLLNSTAVDRDTNKRDKAVLFLTDGQAEEFSGAILNEISSRSSLGVSFLTFGLGKELDAAALKLLKDMSEASLGNVSLAKPGISKVVQDANNLRYEMGSYYNTLSVQTDPNGVVISIPYVDYSGLGLITSICMPIYHGGTLKGVTGIDVGMEDLIADVIYYHQGTDSYVFIIDGTGRVILHPLLPQPADLAAFDWQPVFIGIDSLERSSEVNDVISDMQRGGSGSKQLWTTMVAANGEAKRDGVSPRNVRAEYIWKQIGSTNFSLCMVVPLNTTNLVVSGKSRLPSTRFIHHRFDLLSANGDVPPCQYISSYSTLAGPVVKFTPDAFKDPQYFLTHPEDKDDVVEYKLYMEGDDDFAKDKFRDGVRGAVGLTLDSVDSNWKKFSPYLDNIVWRYVGLEVGAQIRYPGGAYDPSYDPTLRPWYRMATAHPGDVVLTSPYLDATGAGIVTTIAKTLVQGKNAGHAVTDRVVGVMGLDFKLDTIKLLIQKEFSQCRDMNYKCFLVDTSGYIVYHEDFVASEVSSKDVEFYHIAKKEEYITQYLLSNGHLTKQRCDDLEPKKTYHSYKLYIPGGVISNLESQPSFDAQRVPDSNVYLFIKNKIASIPENRCYCPTVPSDIEKCRSLDQCECPCFTPTSFQYCRNKYETVQDSPAVCTPDTAQRIFTNPIIDLEQRLGNLPECYMVNCSAKTDSGVCNAVLACSWCSFSGRVGCHSEADCPIRTPTPPPSTGTTEGQEVSPGDASNIGVIVGAVVGCLVLVLIIVIVVVLLLRYRKSKDGPYQGHQIHDFMTDSDSRIQGESGGRVNRGLRLSAGDGPSPSNYSGSENNYSSLDLLSEHSGGSVPSTGTGLPGARGRPPSLPSGHPQHPPTVVVDDTYLTARQSVHASHNVDPRARQHMM